MFTLCNVFYDFKNVALLMATNKAAAGVTSNDLDTPLHIADLDLLQNNNYGSLGNQKERLKVFRETSVTLFKFPCYLFLRKPGE